jgi:hypothetical protein
MSAEASVREVCRKNRRAFAESAQNRPESVADRAIEGNRSYVVSSFNSHNSEQATMKKPLFDVSRFNRLADKYNIPWIDRIPLIETVCWGSKGWLDSALVAKLRGRWNGYRRNAEYGAFMGEVMSALSAPIPF